MIQTDRLVLRPVTAADVDVLHRIWTDAGVRRYLWDDVVIDRATAQAVVEEMEALWRERGYGVWLAHDRESGAPIGFAGFRAPKRSEDPELLFGLLPEWWHRGLATEAARAALEFLFSDTAVGRVWAETDVPNAASMRVLERAGMRFVGNETAEGRETALFAIERISAAARS